MNAYPKNTLPVVEVKKFLMIFYSIGIIGFLIPWSHSLFVVITPLALLLSSYLLAIYHDKYAKKDVIIFLLILILGFFIEVIGVKTGSIFGNYVYGEALGIKIFNTPLLIGLNWLFLTYTSVSISEYLSRKVHLQFIIAPTIMLIYDIVLEQLAPRMEMWSWTDSTIPIKNFIAWWLIGFVFTGIFKLFRINTHNPLALAVFLCQFLFFVVLLFIYNIF